MADKYVVKEGKQVIFSSDEEDACHAVAGQKRMELMNRGCDIRNDEFKLVIETQN